MKHKGQYAKLEQKENHKGKKEKKKSKSKSKIQGKNARPEPNEPKYYPDTAPMGLSQQRKISISLFPYSQIQ